MNRDPFPPITSPEEIRGLHAEIQQLHNQQFLLATAALTVFGFAAWTTPRGMAASSSPHTFENIYATSSVGLLALLGGLFAWSLALHHLALTIGYYLELRGASEWETDYRAFFESKTRPRARSKTRWVAMIYFLLGFLVPGNFISALIISGLPCSLLPLSMVLGASVLYLTGVGHFGFKYRRNTAIRDKWIAILDEQCRLRKNTTSAPAPPTGLYGNR